MSERPLHEILIYSRLIGNFIPCFPVPTEETRHRAIADARRVWQGLRDHQNKYVLRTPEFLTTGDGKDDTTSCARIDTLARDLLRKPRDLDRLFAYPGVLVESTIDDEHELTIDSWRRAVVLNSAALLSIEMLSEAHSRSASELLIQAQWIQFVLLTAPLRCLPNSIWDDGNAYHNIVSVFSTDRFASERYIAKVHEVREALLGTLRHFEDNPTLRQTPGENLENATALTLFSSDNLRSLLEIPENLQDWCDDSLKNSGAQANKESSQISSTATSKEFDDLEELVENFFLPRFNLCVAYRAARMVVPGKKPFISVGIGMIAFVAALVLFVVWPQFSGEIFSAVSVTIPRLWALLAVLSCAFIFGPALFVPRLAQQAWLLRIPASASMGVLVVLALSSQWWKEAWIWPGWKSHLGATLLLLGLAWCYICFEVSGHRVGENSDKRTRTVLGRATAIFGLVLTTATLITLISFGFLFPIFAENTDIQAMPPGVPLTFFQQLASANTCERLLMLLLPSSLVTIIGLFTQVLWDDKAITAPLAHTSWRK